MKLGLHVGSLALALGFAASELFADSSVPAELAPFFHPPSAEFARLGDFRSPLIFADGTRVKTAEEWPRRRAESASSGRK